MFSTLVTVLIALASAQYAPAASTGGRFGPRPGQIKNLVTFGDSYTDVGQPNDGGTAWPVYAARDGNFNLFPFARSGAPCSNKLTPRPSPALFESQLPLFLEELHNGTLRLDPEETIITLWIGTNDVGRNALLTGSDKGVTVADITECAIDFLKIMYDNGARNFLFQNMIPLQRTILYSPVSYPNRYWTKERNTTQWSDSMTELVGAGNALSRALLQLLAPTLHGAHVGLFDSHAMFTEMLDNPQDFFNGTAPLNTTGAVHACVFELNEEVTANGTCTDAVGSDRDSFIWWDELHPSEQADRQVAKAVAAAINRKTEKWTTWFS